MRHWHVLIEQVDCVIDRSTDALALRLDTGIDTAGSYDVLINPGDIADGVLVNALWAVGQMVARPRTSRRHAHVRDNFSKSKHGEVAV